MKGQPIKSKSTKKTRSAQKSGKAPGTIKYYGNKAHIEKSISLFSYTIDTFLHKKISLSEEVISHFSNKNQTYWLNIIGLNDEDLIKKLGTAFNLNVLSLEDAVDTEQRPKIDDFDHYVFGVFKMVYLDKNQEINYEHVALVLLENTVVVFQELEDDVYDGVRTRLSLEESRIRARGADYLFFALLDAMVDHYFIALEHLGSKLEELENSVYENPNQSHGIEIQQLKKEILKLRQHIYPTKDLVERLLDSKHPLISAETKVFLRDLLDHATEINETLQLYKELSINLMELYMSTMSNKMNEVMKVLTIMASIFIPLTFIAGVYGMNFVDMPELHWKFGYGYVLILMGMCFIGMLFYFSKKKWL
ncbi:MAG: magnesium/cobalt transporter CorA [Flavobacteriaceae bacterium]|tara:strand:+ start:209 stop:1297 length:1089 start_codon:yes stop_codon:yes gene_type:complete